MAKERQLTILDFNVARDNGMAVASARPVYADHLHLAPNK